MTLDTGAGALVARFSSRLCLLVAVATDWAVLALCRAALVGKLAFRAVPASACLSALGQVKPCVTVGASGEACGRGLRRDFGELEVCIIRAFSAVLAFLLRFLFSTLLFSLLLQTDVPTRLPTFPAAQSVQVEEDVAPMTGLDFPRPHFAHSLSASVSFRVWLR